MARPACRCERCGGVTVVQNPGDAVAPDMPLGRSRPVTSTIGCHWPTSGNCSARSSPRNRARYSRVVRDPAHRPRHALFRRHDDGRPARRLARDRRAHAAGLPQPSTPGGSAEGRYIKWHTIADQQRAVVEDATRIRKHPLVDPTVPIYGYVYDVKTGRLNEVAAATEAGRPLR
jgi:hypothetical protein